MSLPQVVRLSDEFSQAVQKFKTNISSSQYLMAFFWIYRSYTLQKISLGQSTVPNKNKIFMDLCGLYGQSNLIGIFKYFAIGFQILSNTITYLKSKDKTLKCKMTDFSSNLLAIISSKNNINVKYFFSEF